MFYRPADGHGLPHDPFKAIVTPRPIGWISTLDAEGRANLAPYSFFNAVADAPPHVESHRAQSEDGSLEPGVMVVGPPPKTQPRRGTNAKDDDKSR